PYWSQFCATTGSPGSSLRNQSPRWTTRCGSTGHSIWTNGSCLSKSPPRHSPPGGSVWAESIRSMEISWQPSLRRAGFGCRSSISNRRFTGGPHDYGYDATMSNAITDKTAEQPAPRVKRSHVAAWAMWDWGSAAFNAVMITFVFGTYLASDAFGAGDRGTSW